MAKNSISEVTVSLLQALFCSRIAIPNRFYCSSWNDLPCSRLISPKTCSQHPELAPALAAGRVAAAGGAIRMVGTGGRRGARRIGVATLLTMSAGFAVLTAPQAAVAAPPALSAAQLLPQQVSADPYTGGGGAQHATEVERVQVDSIVHDSVLTTLLSAAAADTVESTLAAPAIVGAPVLLMTPGCTAAVAAETTEVVG